MNNDPSERLRAARIKAGYGSASEAASTFGWTASAYRHHENGTRGFGPDLAKKYGRAFRVRPGWLLCMDGVDRDAPESDPAPEPLVVGGIVAAGVWRESEESEAPLSIDLAPLYPGASRLGFMVEGRSMDEFYTPGTILDCVSLFDLNFELENGDHVIVERISSDGLRERTVKEYLNRNGSYFLRPRSTDPRFEEIEIGKPDCSHTEGDETRVIGLVLGHISPRSLDLLRRLGKVTE